MKLIGNVWQQGGCALFFRSNNVMESFSLLDQTIQDLEGKIKAQEKAIRDRENYIKNESTIVQNDLTEAEATVAKLISKLRLVNLLIADSEAQQCEESELPLQEVLIEGMYANKAKIQAQLEEEKAYALELTEELAEVNKNSASYQRELPQAKETLHGLKVKLGTHLTETIIQSIAPSMA